MPFYLFEQLKANPNFEKWEKIFKKKKFFYCLLFIFTLMGIIFQIIDVLIYNK